MTTTQPMPNLGTQQSPIALDVTIGAELGVSIHWDALRLKPRVDGYTPPRKLYTQPNRKSGHLRMDGQRYIPIDVHWHFPAEHVIGKRHTRFAAEVHIVHVHRDDMPYALQGKLDWCRIVVLGVFLRSGREPYAPITVADGAAGDDVRATTISRAELLPEDLKAIRYRGSLTTPPYSENVTFVVFETAMTATKAQLADDGLPNARALQGCNRRFCLSGHVEMP